MPTWEIEMALRAQGHHLVAGLDEAGRGAWAGPVVAAAVILPLDRSGLQDILAQVRDSKEVPPAEREALFDLIREVAVACGVGIVAPAVIDREGIVPATRQAMTRALAQLSPQPGHLILDYVRLSAIPLPQVAFPKADQRCFCVAAASILAKVTRDRLMRLLDASYPGYGFAQHKGYGTPMHQAALADLGPCRIHRMSFAPVHQTTLYSGSNFPLKNRS